ncbi:MAG TPA: LuxR C-terminal-related transcriptional regulator [Dehalococcoidia bacterium]|nr:LuxR C-terminal-related transcriptional regulator [Dehalococcoidia bacterium]
MAYPIRYARTSDGVNIAYCELGQGEPLIELTAVPWSHFAVGFGIPEASAHPEALAAGVRLIVYDGRGTGLSDHGVSDLTLDGFARDIDAVAHAAGHERFALYGSLDSTRVMIHYAALHPERVTKLILWLPSVGADRLRDDGLRAVTSLAGRNWELYIKTLSHAVIGGWDPERGEFAAAYAAVMKHSIRPEEFGAFLQALHQHDVTPDLPRVQAPTLVLGREAAVAYTVPVVSEVAAGIEDARLIVLPGNWMLPCTDDQPTSNPATRPSRLIIDFMRGGAASPPVRAADTSVLSAREIEVLALLSAGKTNAEIAGALVVAPATASRHVHNILNKLGMSRRAEAAAYAVRAGLSHHGAHEARADGAGEDHFVPTKSR